MSRIKYGIDLGTTNSAIAVIKKGESTIVKNELQKDTTPSCVGFRKGVIVGDKAFNQLNSDKLNAQKKGVALESNFFIEFKRTMGTDIKYHSSKMDKDYSSEELSAEVLKYLKSKVQNEEFKSVVITIPAMFNDNQKSATQRAAELAGFSQVELLQEPIAAAIAYGLDEKLKDGKIIIFDFGGGTFDVCLVEVEDGIMQVKDTEGDNWLGGKNLDNAIVDQIMIPYLKENYTIDSFLNDDLKSGLLKEALKIEAEKIKINLSFSDSYDVISNLGEYPEDDEGEEIELDFTVTKEQLKPVLGLVFQKAIDSTLNVLKRNNLDGNSISSLILVGGPTFSPVLREMLEEQVCKPDTSVDPMTVVARGAAIYASQFELDESIKDETRDASKIQLDLSYEPQSVEIEEMLVVKLNKAKTEGDIPNSLFVNVKRSDGAWESDKIQVDESGDIIHLQLKEGKPNVFEIFTTDESGDKISCEPSEFTIIQGVKTGNAPLAFHYGVGLLGDNERENFYTIQGLEKGQTMPANGMISGLKTQKDIRPGSDDTINVSIYQGSVDAEDTRASSQLWVHTVKFTGNEISRLLPKDSEANISLEIERDGIYNLSIDIPFLNETFDYHFEKQEQKGEDDQWFDNQFKQLEAEIDSMKKQNGNENNEALEKLASKVAETKRSYESRKSDNDTRMQTRDNIKRQFAELDNIEKENAWPSTEKKLKEIYYDAEDLVKELDNDDYRKALDRLKSQMSNVIEKKDIAAAQELISVIGALNLKMIEDKHGVELYISWIAEYNQEFNAHPWTDKTKARSIINNALREAQSNPTKERMIYYLRELWKLLPDGKRKGPGDILGR